MLKKASILMASVLLLLTSLAGCGDPCQQAQEHLQACGVAAPMQSCDAAIADSVLSMSCEMIDGASKAERRGDASWWCEILNNGCPSEPAPEGAPSRYPIILAHGFNAQPGRAPPASTR